MKGFSVGGKSSAVFLIVLLVAANGCATATYQTGKALSSAPENRRIVLLTPDVELAVLHAGGVEELNAEWTKLAKKHITQYLSTRFRKAKVRMVKLGKEPKDPNEDQREVQLLKLHGAMGRAILVHQPDGAPLQLPTKAGKFDWSMGPDARYLKKKFGADYALFIFVRDSYTSSGRVAAIFLAAALGVSIRGGVQLGFSSLVDLNSGEVVWFNRLARGRGDLRTAGGAAETMNVLLSNFPQ